MTRPILHVDFNEMVEPNLFLLAPQNSKNDINGHAVSLREGLEIIVYDEDMNKHGQIDKLMADGVVESNKIITGWGSNVKWCCRVNESSFRYQSGAEYK